MPGFGHLFFGLFLTIPMLYIAKDRLNYKIAIIFVLTNWIGPDSFWPWRSIIPFDFHTLLGYALWAIPLALFYSYLSRFSLVRTKRFLNFVDDGKRDVKWKNAYLLCIAGGISHTLLDTLFETEFEINIFGFKLDLFGYGARYFNIKFDVLLEFFRNDLKLGLHYFFGISSALIILAFVVLAVTSVLVIFILKRDLKDKLIFIAAMSGLLLLGYLTLGEGVFQGELDIVTIFFTLIFFFIPLMLVAYVANDVYKNPTEEPKTSRITKKLGINLVAGIMTAITILFIYLGLIVVFVPQILTELVGFDVQIVAILIGFLISIISSIGLVGSIGLFLRINFCRYLVMFYCIVLYIFVYPFAVLLYLSKEDVREMFIKKSKD